MMALTRRSSAQQRHYLESIYNQGKHLLEIINSMLDLSQSELGQMTLNIQQVSLSALIQDCLQDYRLNAENRSITLTLETSAEPPHDGVAADPHRLKQVIAILLSNAVKFTPAGGCIAVRLSLNEAEAIIQVQDTGIGIAEHHQTIIFRKFKQLDDSYHRQYEGTGIGLALAKQLVELHNGCITCDSSLEAGALFTVRLPRAPALGMPLSCTVPTGHLGRRILLVDGQSESARAIADRVTAVGCQLIWMLEGRRLVKEVGALQPDCVIVGSHITDVDSRELIYSLRQALPRVLIAAVDDGRSAEALDLRHHYQSLGVDSVLSTQVDIDNLLEGLRQDGPRSH